MFDTFDDLKLVPVGIVHSPVVERREMPAHGVRARVEVFREFHDGLLLIEGNTHLWIVGWFAGAERDQHQIVRPEYRSGERRRGVFGLRSTTRPNSLGMCASSLVEVQDGWLTLDHLDFLDGTMVVDIKRYSPSWDAIFAARSSREQFVTPEEAARMDILEMDAAKFHGALTPGVHAASRLLQTIITDWQVLPRDQRLSVAIPATGSHGDIIDAIQGITAASFGNGRLSIHPSGDIRFTEGERVRSVQPRAFQNLSTREILSAAIEELFDIRDYP